MHFVLILHKRCSSKTRKRIEVSLLWIVSCAGLYGVTDILLSTCTGFIIYTAIFLDDCRLDLLVALHSCSVPTSPFLCATMSVWAAD